MGGGRRCPKARQDLAAFPCRSCGGPGPFSKTQSKKGAARRCCDCVDAGDEGHFPEEPAFLEFDGLRAALFGASQPRPSTALSPAQAHTPGYKWNRWAWGSSSPDDADAPMPAAGAAQVGREVLVLEETMNSMPDCVNPPRKLARLLRQQGAVGARTASAKEAAAAIKAGACGALVVPNLCQMCGNYCLVPEGPPFSVPSDAEALKKWVEAGGTLILTADEAGDGEHVGAGLLLDMFGIPWRNTRILCHDGKRSPACLQLVPSPNLPWPKATYSRARLMTAVAEEHRLYSCQMRAVHSKGVPTEEQDGTFTSVAAASVGNGLVSSIGVDLEEHEGDLPILYALVEKAQGLDAPQEPLEDDPEELLLQDELLGVELLEEELEERSANFGFTRGELEELRCQFVKPWDEEAWDVIDALRGGDEYREPGLTAYNMMRMAHTGKGFDDDCDSGSSSSWETVDSEEGDDLYYE